MAAKLEVPRLRFAPGRCRSPDEEPVFDPVEPTPETTKRARESPPRSAMRSCAKVCKKAVSLSLARGAPTPRSDTLSAPRKTAVLQAFLDYGEDQSKGQLRV